MPTDSSKRTRYDSISLDLREPRSPHELDDRLLEIGRECGIDFWIHGGLKVAREAIAACHLGKFFKASTVRMADREWPDFWLTIADEEIPFELVGVHNPHAIIPRWLKDSLNYYLDGSDPAPLPVDLRIVEQELDVWINNEVEKKAVKAAEGNYEPGTVLAVYVEFYVPNEIGKVMFRSVANAVADKVPSFRAIVTKIGRQTFIHDMPDSSYNRLSTSNSDLDDEFVTTHYSK